MGDFQVFVRGIPPAAPYVKPSLSWDATPGKFYTLLLADLMSPAFLPSGDASALHWAVYNIQGNDLASGQERSKGFLNPVNPYSVPNSYVFFLFEHDAMLTTVAAEQFLASGTAFILKDFITTLGLDASHLVSVNWWRVSSSIVSNIGLAAIGASKVIPSDSCATLTNGLPDSGALNMCSIAIDAACPDYAPAKTTWPNLRGR